MATELDSTTQVLPPDSFVMEKLRCVSLDVTMPSPSSTSESTDEKPSNQRSRCQSLDADGLPVIDRETIIDALWKSNEDHAMSMLELTKTFDLGKKKNGPRRRFKFRQVVAELTYIRNDRVKGFTLVLKRCHYPAAS